MWVLRLCCSRRSRQGEPQPTTLLPDPCSSEDQWLWIFQKLDEMQNPRQTSRIRICILARAPGDSFAHESFTSTVLESWTSLLASVYKLPFFASNLFLLNFLWDPGFCLSFGALDMLCYFQLPPSPALQGFSRKEVYRMAPIRGNRPPGAPASRQPEKEKPLLWWLTSPARWQLCVTPKKQGAALLLGKGSLGPVCPFFHWREFWAFCPPLEPSSPHGQFLFTPIRVDSKENWPVHWRYQCLGLAAHPWQL